MILSAFGVGYMLLTSFGGWMVDVFGARLVWPVAAISWSLCVGALGFAESFMGFIVLRFLLGITEGPHFPAMSVTVNNWLPASERARALSFGLVAIPLSAVIGAPAYLLPGRRFWLEGYVLHYKCYRYHLGVSLVLLIYQQTQRLPLTSTMPN